MSHNIQHQYIHLIWPTKDLRHLLTKDSQSSFFSYFAGILKKLGGQLLASSGASNHVHLLANAPTDLSIAELVSQIKSCSSKWYRENDHNQIDFGWNTGYSAFTVSPASLDNVKNYLSTKSHRHMNRSFEDELTRFLKIQEIEFKPQFLTSTTYTRLIYHIVWTVKNREPLLNSLVQIPLHERIEQEVQKTEGKLYAIGNVADHIHLLVECPSKISTASLVQKLKTTATHLIKSLDRKSRYFCWQEGYGVFSVGKPALEVVANYINNQESHHKTKTFHQEWDWLREINWVG